MLSSRIEDFNVKLENFSVKKKKSCPGILEYSSYTFVLYVW